MAKTYWTKLRTNLAIGTTAVMLISVVVLFFVKGENTKKDNEVTHKDIESRIYDTPLELQQAKDHDNEVPTDVENFKREQRLIEQGDTLLTYQAEISENIKVIDSFFQFAKDKKYSDSIGEITKQISRNQRSDDIKLLLNNSINQTNAINAINQRLDTIN